MYKRSSFILFYFIEMQTLPGMALCVCVFHLGKKGVRTSVHGAATPRFRPYWNLDLVLGPADRVAL
jgi:hypothetical protein